MDTDDLSEELYKAAIGTATEFHEDLRLQFGLLGIFVKMKMIMQQKLLS